MFLIGKLPAKHATGSLGSTVWLPLYLCLNRQRLEVIRITVMVAITILLYQHGIAGEGQIWSR